MHVSYVTCSVHKVLEQAVETLQNDEGDHSCADDIRRRKTTNKNEKTIRGGPPFPSGPNNRLHSGTWEKTSSLGCRFQTGTHPQKCAVP